MIEKYIELLLGWVGKVRLTGAQTEETIREHVDDARAAAEFLPARCGKIIDVGTGGGLPGVVWAILRPDAEFVLLDSVRKKCRAVEQMCGELGLKNTSVVCERAEIYAKQTGEIFDVATARALTATPALVAWLAPFVKTGGAVLAFKGPKFQEECAGMEKSSWKKFRLAPPEIFKYGREGRGNIIVSWKKLKKERS